MKILVISDTHGDISNARRAIKQNRDIDLIIHLGDYFRDAENIKKEFPYIPIEYIYGNSDFLVNGTPAEKLLEIEGKRFFLTHGHKYSVKWDYSRLFIKAKEVGADILLFGHTHIADIVENEHCSLVNPGSISDSRSSLGESYALIDITGGKVQMRLCYI
ncbi:MAG TPA: metallophosphoesterase [Clostridiaceae bacterium]|nr:metallophosphoesterase [Clostridiaceae bacterium]